MYAGHLDGLMKLAVVNEGLLSFVVDNPFHIPVFGPLIRLCWSLYWLGNSLASRLGLYGHDWSLLFAGLIAYAATAVVYAIFRVFRIALGRDYEYEYWRYQRAFGEQDSILELGAFAYRPQRHALAIVVSHLSPLMVIGAVGVGLLELVRFFIWLVPDTIFGTDPLDNYPLYLVDLLLSFAVHATIRLLAFVIAVVAIYHTVRWVASKVSETSLYGAIARRASRGRAKVVRHR